MPTQNQTDVPSNQTVVTATNNFRYIQHKTSFESIEQEDFFKSNTFYLLLLLPFLAIPLGIFIGKKKAERDQRERERPLERHRERERRKKERDRDRDRDNDIYIPLLVARGCQQRGTGARRRQFLAAKDGDHVL